MKIGFNTILIMLVIQPLISPVVQISATEGHGSFQAMIFPLQPSSIKSDSHLFFLHDVIDEDAISMDMYHVYDRISNNDWMLGNKIIGEGSSFSLVNYQYTNKKSWGRPILKEDVLSSYFISGDNLVYSIFNEESGWDEIIIIESQKFFQMASIVMDSSINYLALFDSNYLTYVVWLAIDNLGNINDRYFISVLNNGSIGDTVPLGEIDFESKSQNGEYSLSIIMNGSVPIVYSKNLDRRSIFKTGESMEVETVKWNITDNYQSIDRFYNENGIVAELLLNNRYLFQSYFEEGLIHQSIYYLDLLETTLTPKKIDFSYELKLTDVPLIIFTENENITIGYVSNEKIVWGSLDLNLNIWEFNEEKKHNKILTFGSGREYFFEGIEFDNHISIFLDMFTENYRREIYEFEFDDQGEENIIQVTNDVVFSDDYKPPPSDRYLPIKYIFGIFGLAVLIVQRRSRRKSPL